MKGKNREGKKWKRLSVRLLPEEWDFFCRQADELGMSVSDFVRSRMPVVGGGGKKKNTGKKTKKEYREVAAQIARVGNNLNQVARWVNTYKPAADAARVIVLLAGVRDEMRRIREMIMKE